MLQSSGCSPLRISLGQTSLRPRPGSDPFSRAVCAPHTLTERTERTSECPVHSQPPCRLCSEGPCVSSGATSSAVSRTASRSKSGSREGSAPSCTEQGAGGGGVGFRVSLQITGPAGEWDGLCKKEAEVTPGRWPSSLTPRCVRPGEEQISGGKIQTLVSDMVSCTGLEPGRAGALSQVGSPGGSREGLSTLRRQTVTVPCCGSASPCRSPGGGAERGVRGLLPGACFAGSRR